MSTTTINITPCIPCGPCKGVVRDGIRVRPRIIIMVIFAYTLCSFLIMRFLVDATPASSNTPPLYKPFFTAPPQTRQLLELPPPVPVFERKLRMLFLTHAYNYETGMDRFFFTHYYALKNHQWMEVRLWGIGIDNWNGSATIRENLMSRYGSLYFDVIYMYGMAKNPEIFDISKEVIVLIRENECWERRCEPYFKQNGASLIMMNFAHEVLFYEDFAKQALIVHTPQSTDSSIFFHPVDSPRDIDVLMIGKADKVVYPLRQRLMDLIQAGKIPGGTVRSHPGYFAKRWDTSFWKDYQLNMTAVQIADDQVHDYAALIKRAKICVFDSSIYKYAYQKYTEVPMAGCLAVADIPHERMDEFRLGMAEITMDMTDEEIVNVINYWRQHDEERIEKATLGQHMAMKYTALKWGDTVIKSVNHLKTKGYGIVLDHQFQLACAAQSHMSLKFQNEYCHSKK